MTQKLIKSQKSKSKFGDQIDLVATVASAFSEFAKLPPKMMNLLI